MPIHFLFSSLQKTLNRRSFLKRTAGVASMLYAVFSGNKQQSFARGLRRSALVDPATRSPDSTYFGIIGDYGHESRDVSRVAAMIRSWDPDFITTVGDNIYDYESPSTVDDCVGQYFTRFISPYNGSHGEDSGVNRFYPILGNHDWSSIEVDEHGTCSGPYFDFFPERDTYYTFQEGPVRFFMLDSQDSEPDGNTALSTQGMWLRDQLALSTATWNLVYLHHPPYSSGIKHGANMHLRWPFQQWGAHAVFAGHNHTYERIDQDGIVYFVNGLGGVSKHGLATPKTAGSQASYAGKFGAMLVAVNTESMTLEFLTTEEELIDSHTMLASDFVVVPEIDPTPDYNRQSVTLTRRLSTLSDNVVAQRADSVPVPSDHLLEFGTPEMGELVSAVRFTDISIPLDAEIVDAYIEFTASESNAEAAAAEIYGEKSCYSSAYGADMPAIGDRPATSARVAWAEIEPWRTIGASYRTPNLADIMQELIEQPLWQEDTTVAFTISGQGKRSSVSFGLQPAAAPRLHVHYTIPLLSESQQLSAANDFGSNNVYIPAFTIPSCDIPDEE